MSGLNLGKCFVGVGAQELEIYLKSKKNAPCIVFIDEIDAVGRKEELDKVEEMMKGTNPKTTSC